MSVFQDFVVTVTHGGITDSWSENVESQSEQTTEQRVTFYRARYPMATYIHVYEATPMMLKRQTI